MAYRLDLTLDTADAPRLAEFWKVALGYVDEAPATPVREQRGVLEQFGLPEDDGNGAWLCDPDGVGQRLSLIDVPEPKVVKNGDRCSSWRASGSSARDVVPLPGDEPAVPAEQRSGGDREDLAPV